MKRKTKGNNKGFSMVELLIAIAISVILAGSVFSFMVVGSRAFSSNSAEVELQSESQLIANQLQDLLIDTAIGVEYFYNAGAGNVEITSDSEIGAGTTVVSKELYMYDTNAVYVARWIADESRLYYAECDVTVNTDPVTGEKTAVCGAERTLGGPQLIGESITDFSVDLSDVESRNVVRVNMELQDRNRTYRSSHNITLRNKIVVGKEIPEYVDFTKTPETAEITGPDVIYMEPGDTYNIPANHTIEVKGADGNLTASQDVYFVTPADTSAYAAGTGINTSGVVTTSKAQTQDFQVMVYSADGLKSKTISVKMILVESITITFKESASAEDELETGKLSDDLAAGEEFELTATLQGRNLEQAGTPDVYKMVWNIEEGKDLLTIISQGDSVVSADKKSATSVCKCKMNDSLSITSGVSVPIKLSATSVRSLNKYATPVVGYFTGGAYRKKEDIRIDPTNPEATMMRGMHAPYYVKLSDANGIDLTKYVCLYEVIVTETEYCQDGSVIHNTPYVNKDNYVMGEGNGVGITPAETLNPNSTYTYEYCLYVFEPKQPWEANRWGILKDYPNYNKDECKYVSNVVVQTLAKVDVYLSITDANGKQSGYASADGTKDTLILRTFNFDRLGGGEQINHTLRTGVSKAIREDKLNNLILNLYVPREDGSWYYSEETKYEVPSDKKWLDIPNSNAAMTIRYSDRNWDGNIPQHLRLVPSLAYKDADGTQKYAIMYNSYVDIYTKNIEVKNYDPQQIGTTSWCYFPAPTDNNFPGSTNGQKLKWLHAYPINVPTIENAVYNKEILYTLSNQNNADDTIRWNLELFMMDNNGTPQSIGQYYCDSDDNMWTLKYY